MLIQKCQFYRLPLSIFTLIVSFYIMENDSLLAQGIAINSAGNTPSSSAILDLSSTSQGVLIPRMTDTQRQELKDPAIGLVIYNTNSNQLNYYNGSGWQVVLNNSSSSNSGSGITTGRSVAINFSGSDPDPSAILDIASIDRGILIPRTTRALVSPTKGLLIYNTSTNTFDYYNGTLWNTLCNTNIDNVFAIGAVAKGISINGSGVSSDPSAILDISSTSKGILLPRMTSTERDLIKSPATGLLLYNISTDRIESWDGSGWYEMQNDLDVLAAPTANSATNITSNSFEANWTAVSGATGYFLDVATNSSFTSFVSGYNNKSLGTVTSTNVTGLSCGNTYYYRLRAASTCGSSVNSNTNSDQTTVCYNGCYDGSTVVQDVTNIATGRTWMDRNLGASRAATSKTDASAYGGLNQWGRCTDGHEVRTSGITNTLSSTNDPGHGLYIRTTSAPHDWRSPQNNSLWQGASASTNPCPSTYRLPTETEINNERLSWSSNDETGAYASVLKFTIGGRRTQGGSLQAVSDKGYYWTSTISGTDAKYLYIASFISVIGTLDRAHGFSVRCIKD